MRDNSIRGLVPLEPMGYDAAVLAALGERAAAARKRSSLCTENVAKATLSAHSPRSALPAQAADGSADRPFADRPVPRTAGRATHPARPVVRRYDKVAAQRVVAPVSIAAASSMSWTAWARLSSVPVTVDRLCDEGGMLGICSLEHPVHRLTRFVLHCSSSALPSCVTRGSRATAPPERRAICTCGSETVKRVAAIEAPTGHATKQPLGLLREFTDRAAQPHATGRAGRGRPGTTTSWPTSLPQDSGSGQLRQTVVPSPTTNAASPPRPTASGTPPGTPHGLTGARWSWAGAPGSSCST